MLWTGEEFQYYVGAPLSYKGPPCPITPAGAQFGNRTYGGQCFIDQLCAVGLSTAAGLGCCFDPAHEATARSSVLKYNTIGPQRTVKPIVAHFAQGDSGIIVCTNPHNTSDGNPNDGHMVSSGFESPLLASMLFDRNHPRSVDRHQHASSPLRRYVASLKLALLRASQDRADANRPQPLAVE